jgi:hypothetical protein
MQNGFLHLYSGELGAEPNADGDFVFLGIAGKGMEPVVVEFPTQCDG